MSLPFFFNENIEPATDTIVLDEENSKHIVQVLRMKRGELIQVTDGRGRLIRAEIVRDHKKNCEVRVLDAYTQPKSPKRISIALSLLKNSSRFEWFLEKATELGVNEIIPMVCSRTVKQHFRFERMKSICVSAMLQSQQSWLPDLLEPASFDSVLSPGSYQQKFVAHCLDDNRRELQSLSTDTGSAIILIGPEGDFSEAEIQSAIDNGYQPVSLGSTRLRTETAALTAAVLLTRMNHKQ